jgi:hypothetical protein
MTGNPEVIGSSFGLVPTNALVVIEIGANLPDGWQPGNKCWYRPVRVRENRQFLAEHLLNNKLQMSAFGATEGLVTQTKQMKIGLCEQVRVNWKTGVYATNASIIVTSEIGDETPGAALNAHSQNGGRLPGSMSEMKPSKERRQRLGGEALPRPKPRRITASGNRSGPLAENHWRSKS